MIEVKAGYKQTELGVIPEDWDLKPLGQISDVFMGQSPSGATYNKNGEGVALINGPTEFTDVSPVKVQWTTQPTKICKADDLLICVRGSSTGRMNIADDEYCIGRGVAAIRAKASSNTVYLTNQIHLGIEKLLTLSVGSTFPNIDGKSIRSIQIPLPPTLAEQSAIATVLSDTDALIERLEKQIAKKKAIKQGAVQELLAPKKGWRSFFFSELLEIPITYGVVTAGAFQNSGIPMLRGGDIKEGKINIIDVPTISPEKNQEYSRTILKRNDIVIALVGYPGDAAKVTDSYVGANISRAVGLIRLKGKAFPDYLVQFLNSPIGRKKVLNPSAGSAQVVVNLKEMNKLKFELPPHDEQNAIATILSDMDTEIEALKQKRDKYTMIKQGMMQQLLTGRIRIHGTN